MMVRRSGEGLVNCPNHTFKFREGLGEGQMKVW